jgi:hypothetical protein
VKKVESSWKAASSMVHLSWIWNGRCSHCDAASLLDIIEDVQKIERMSSRQITHSGAGERPLTGNQW